MIGSRSWTEFTFSLVVDTNSFFMLWKIESQYQALKIEEVSFLLFTFLITTSRRLGMKNWIEERKLPFIGKPWHFFVKQRYSTSLMYTYNFFYFEVKLWSEIVTELKECRTVLYHLHRRYTKESPERAVHVGRSFGSKFLSQNRIG